MATISDVYQIITDADLSGLNEAARAQEKIGGKLKEVGRSAAAAALGIERSEVSLKRLTAAGLLSGLSKIGGMLKTIGVGLLGLGGVAVAGVFGLVRGVGALADRLRETEEAGSGAAAAMEDTGAAADEAASGIADVGTEAVKAADKVTVAFGAFGAVGAGYIQAQGRVTKQTADQAEAAASAASAATKALKTTDSALGGSAKTVSNFLKQVDRIGAAWNKSVNRVLKSIAKGLAPALERLADLMESPEFEAFVELIAEDAAYAAEKLAVWFVNKAIPAIVRFMKTVREVGGPINYLKDKFQELKDKIEGGAAGMLYAFETAFNAMEWIGKTVISNLVGLWLLEIQALQTGFSNLKAGLVGIFSNLGDIIGKAFDRVLSGVKAKLNSLIDSINIIIEGYNTIARVTGLGSIPTIPSLAEGGIVTQPTLALIGDNPSQREAVIPLDDPAAGGLGGTVIENIFISVTGNMDADVFMRELQARGIRVPAIA